MGDCGRPARKIASARESSPAGLPKYALAAASGRCADCRNPIDSDRLREFEICPNLLSNRSAAKASRILSGTVRVALAEEILTSCCVIVEPPEMTRPRSKISQERTEGRAKVHTWMAPKPGILNSQRSRAEATFPSPANVLDSFPGEWSRQHRKRSSAEIDDHRCAQAEASPSHPEGVRRG